MIFSIFHGTPWYIQGKLEAGSWANELVPSLQPSNPLTQISYDTATLQNKGALPMHHATRMQLRGRRREKRKRNRGDEQENSESQC